MKNYNKRNILIIILYLIGEFKIIINKYIQVEENHSYNRLIYREKKNKEIMNENIKNNGINYLNYKNKNTKKLKFRFLESGASILSEEEEISDSTSDTYSIEPEIKHCFIITSNTCSKCHDNYYPNSNKSLCLTCSQLNNGCKSCYDDGVCQSCPDNFTKQETNGNISCENKCLDKNFSNGTLCQTCEELNSNCLECDNGGYCTKCKDNFILTGEDNKAKCISKEIIETKGIHLKFMRIDSYEKENNNFRIHFLLLDYFLKDAKLSLKANINFDDNLRILDEQTIDCQQYGDALGKINNQFLVNFYCNIGNSNSLQSIEIKEMGITSGSYTLSLGSQKKINITEIEKEKGPLEEEYKNYTFNKITITEISDITLNDKLSFNINGKIESDIKQDEYNIILKNEQNEQINAICTNPDSNSDMITLSCNTEKNGVKKKLTFEEGMYSAKSNSNNKIILNNKNNIEIDVPQKKKITVGAIVGITLAGIVLVVPFVFYIVKYLIKNKEDNNQIAEFRDDNFGGDINYENNREEFKVRNRSKSKNIKAIDNSKEVIFNN